MDADDLALLLAHSHGKAVVVSHETESANVFARQSVGFEFLAGTCGHEDAGVRANGHAMRRTCF